MRIENSRPKKWWNDRVENEHAWRVSVAELQARNHNFDLKNPHSDAISTTALLHEIAGLDAEIATLKAQLKAALPARWNAHDGGPARRRARRALPRCAAADRTPRYFLPARRRDSSGCGNWC